MGCYGNLVNFRIGKGTPHISEQSVHSPAGTINYGVRRFVAKDEDLHLSSLFFVNRPVQDSNEKTAESLAAARIKRRATGVKIRQAIHMPIKGLTTCDSARLSPVVIKEKYTMKMTAAMTTGAPNPPLLIIDPSEAPIKKSIKRVADRANFR